MIRRASLPAAFGRFACDRGGGPAIEFALTAPFMALLILGVIAVGFEADARIDAREAVRAGAHAVMAGADDPDVVRDVVLNALDGASTGYAVVVTQEFRCGATVVTEDTPCNGGAPPQEYWMIDLDAAAGAAYVDAPPISANIEVRVS